MGVKDLKSKLEVKVSNKQFTICLFDSLVVVFFSSMLWFSSVLCFACGDALLLTCQERIVLTGEEGDGGKKHVGRILEFFKTTDGENYFRVQWFYKVEDTVIKDVGDVHDKRRLFYSTIMNDNLIDCIVSKVNVKHVSPRVGLKGNSILSSDFYYDMEYCVDYSTFRSLITGFKLDCYFAQGLD
ncbi:chromomethylase 2 [Prunus dulcis]|uniref:Chromomethylase 2 n=1 Tax=Prunus dulcis TaxID=3755 RepID=A0A4Y1RFP3_PRUDU|nr:chromomethylase 2 [Prunus dulcis]